MALVGAGGDNLIPPAQADPSRVALVLLNILNRARPPATIIDHGPEDESLLEPAPEPHLTLPEEPDPARHDVTAHSNVRLGDTRPPLPGPQWGWDSTGQVRHVSELRGYASGYTKSGSAALRGVK